jgi:hypothetical protein
VSADTTIADLCKKNRQAFQDAVCRKDYLHVILAMENGPEGRREDANIDVSNVGYLKATKAFINFNVHVTADPSVRENMIGLTAVTIREGKWIDPSSDLFATPGDETRRSPRTQGVRALADSKSGRRCEL